MCSKGGLKYESIFKVEYLEQLSVDGESEKLSEACGVIKGVCDNLEKLVVEL